MSAMNQTIVIPSWLQIAEGELGVKEVPGKGHHPRILEYHDSTNLHARAAGKDETPWCSSFCNWAIEQAGYVGTDSARARSWLRWGLEVAHPTVGAVCVIKRRGKGPDSATGSRGGWHVGFVGQGMETRGFIRLLSGNARDQVKYSNYPLEKYIIKGYRMPVERSV